MATENTLDNLIIISDDIKTHFSLSHLTNLVIIIENFRFENNLVKDITIHVRPTNHVYSRKFEQHVDDQTKLKKTGELLLRYDHIEGKQSLSADVRVFCKKKYSYSKLIPVFIQCINTNYSHICVLPHQGDDRTCLSALINLPSPYEDKEHYIVIFKLHKDNSRTINMVIETAFVVANTDWRIKKFHNRENQKPFINLLINIFAGRAPFEGKHRKAAKKKLKRRKQLEKKLRSSG